MIHSFDIAQGSERIINLSSVSTEEALTAAKLSESVKIKIVNLTPSSGPVTIPVRMVEPFIFPIDFLEEVVENGIATKYEFRLLSRLCKILES